VLLYKTISRGILMRSEASTTSGFVIDLLFVENSRLTE
jgi:hypothetical protein